MEFLFYRLFWYKLSQVLEISFHFIFSNLSAGLRSGLRCSEVWVKVDSRLFVCFIRERERERERVDAEQYDDCFDTSLAMVYTPPSMMRTLVCLDFRVSFVEIF